MSYSKEKVMIIRTVKELFMKNINNSKQLSKLIDQYLIPHSHEKKKNAEVSTPFKLRQEMLDKVPIDFWKTPKKVFEPCVGKGGFILDIIDRFMIGMEYLISDEKIRYKTIVEECLYFSDINPTNIFISKLLIDSSDEYSLNYNEGNTLELDIKDKWSIDSFDAVIGNPPYNSHGNTIWQDFTKQSLLWIKPNGYLVYVHPPGWRKPNTKRGKFYGLYNLMVVGNQMIYLSIHNAKDGKQTFNCGTRYDWYIIEKKPKYTHTVVNDEKGNTLNIDMSKYKWLPNYNIDIIQKILAKEGEEKCEIIYSASAYEHRKKWMSKEKSDEFKYCCIHSTPKNGIRYMYSTLNDKGHFGIPKIIFGETGIYNSIIDVNGDYGLTNGCIGIKIVDLENGKKYKTFLESELMNNIIKSCSFSSFRVDWNIFKEFKNNFWKEFSHE